MDILIIEPIEDEIVRWLEARHTVRYAPEIARDPRAFRQALYNVRSLILPPSLTLDAQVLHSAPVLRAVGRVSSGPENIDADACAKVGVEVVRSSNATANAEAEFVIGAMLSLLRRVPVQGSHGMRVGRELGGAQVGLIGMTPAARALNRLLASFGAQVSGYDPSLHANDAVWERWNVKPLGLRELLENSDAVSVQLAYFSRYHGLLGERYLPFCKPDQVIVSISHSALFDEVALAQVMGTHQVAAAWFDSMEPGLLDEGRPLADIHSLQVTPRVASTTRESRLRSAWAVAHRLHELLTLPSMPAFDGQRGAVASPAALQAEKPHQAEQAHQAHQVHQVHQVHPAGSNFMGLSALPEMTEIDDTAEAAAMFDENGVMLQGDAVVAVVDDVEVVQLGNSQPEFLASATQNSSAKGGVPRYFKSAAEALEADFVNGPVLP